MLGGVADRPGCVTRQVFYNVVRGVPGIALVTKSIFLILPALVRNLITLDLGKAKTNGLIHQAVLYNGALVIFL